MILKNKVAAVFAANGAIASEVCKELAKEGAEVFISGRNLQAIQVLATEIEAEGGKAHAYEVDAIDEQQIDKFCETIVEARGSLDIVFNGIGPRPIDSDYGIPSIELPFESFMKPLELILGSQFLTARLGGKYMMKTQAKGTILMLTASLSRLKTPFMAGITATCTAIEGLTRVLSAEFGKAGIKVMAINPTGMPETRTIQETTSAISKTIGISEEATTSQLQSVHIMDDIRLTPKDTAKVAAFLVSDAGAALNSHIVDVDFGHTNVI